MQLGVFMRVETVKFNFVDLFHVLEIKKHPKSMMKNSARIPTRNMGSFNDHIKAYDWMFGCRWVRINWT